MKVKSKTIVLTLLVLFFGFGSQAVFAESNEQRAKEVGKKVDRAEDKVREKAREAKEKAHELKDKAKETAHNAKEKAREQHDKAKEKAHGLIDKT